MYCQNVIPIQLFSEIRSSAGCYLAELLHAKEFKRFAGVRSIIERHASRALYSPDVIVRCSLAEKMFHGSEKSVPIERNTRYLCWFYQNQALEIKDVLKENTEDVVYQGCFRGENVAIKVMKLEVKALKGRGSNTSKKSSQDYITEGYFLRRFNELARHPNILRLLCCNTSRIPFHLITEFMERGSLKSFLRFECRADISLRGLAYLTHLCLQVIEALIYLKGNKILHRKIMAKSVLVGKEEVCKLSEFGAAKAADDSKPFVDETMDILEGLRWAAPEVISNALFSTASDVWAFGCLMSEVFSFGCTPFRPMANGVPIDDDMKVALIVSH